MKIYFFSKIISTNKLTHSLTHTYIVMVETLIKFSTQKQIVIFTIQSNKRTHIHRKHITNIMSI